VSDLAELIRDVPGFPKEGIVFKDITPLLASHEGLTQAVDQIAAQFEDRQIDVVVGTEARGFVFGPPIALKLGVGFVPVRKPGKLPCETLVESYELEYGTDSVEMHADAIKPGQNVLMVDDLLATGGTMAACCRLVDKLGGKVAGCAFVIELTFLNGREKLADYEVQSLIQYDSE